MTSYFAMKVSWFKLDHLKHVYLTKLTDDARKNIGGQNRNTRLHLTQEKSI